MRSTASAFCGVACCGSMLASSGYVGFFSAAALRGCGLLKLCKGSPQDISILSVMLIHVRMAITVMMLRVVMG